MVCTCNIKRLKIELQLLQPLTNIDPDSPPPKNKTEMNVFADDIKAWAK